MAAANLENLSKSLDLTLNENSPEEHIHRTLRAHGFFNHLQSEKSRRKQNKHSIHGISEEDKQRTTQLVSHFKEGKEFHTLKEPHHLYHYGSSQSNKHQHEGRQRLPLWPSEVECINERFLLLMTPPKHPEPYYTPCSEVVSPKIRSRDDHGTVVYTNLPGPEKYFVNSREGPSLNLPPTQVPSSTDISLQFESRFESGNLRKAVQVGKWDYELYLRYDLYTKKHTQWFYFRVRNIRARQTYRFTIVNLYKAKSLYSEGMQPVFYSEREARDQGLGWQRAGHNIKYFKTPLKRLDTKQEAFCYGVTWSHTFKHGGDTCYFAHSYPYTYSNLQDYLQQILNNREKAKFCKHRVLCHTIAGNPVPLLTITSPSLTPGDSQVKRGVVVTARIHPGETNGSWMMKGLLDFLTGSADDAKILRDLFVFKIIPMLNPDGVVVGNYRCSLSGRDLNRNYHSKMKDSYPTVWHTRSMVKRFCQEREVVMFCDLHGHSRKHNIFIYGCDNLDDPASRLRSRVFPRMLFKNAPDMFSYNSSRFVVQKSKENTGRVVMWREAGIQNSYTLEATFSGSTQGKLRGIQFSTRELEDMGYHLCDTLLDYCDPDQSKTEKIMRELEDDYRKSVIAALASLGQELPPGVDPLDINIGLALAEGDSSDGGSDSSESDGPPVHIHWKQQKHKKKKKLKSRKERNKQKALLKMNHQRVLPIPASSIQHPVLLTDSHSSTRKTKREDKEEKTTEPTTQQSYDILNSHVLNHSGGIPTFVQERLEERQKRREEDDALVGLPAEQLRQALLHIQATHTQQATYSTIFLPQPSCPMSISQAYMHEVSRRQSRINSRVSLESGSVIPPELPPLPQHPPTSKGAFTSQYVAHYLQHIGANQDGCPADESTNTPQTNARNLSNLSRLFRQLRPQTLHSTRAEEQHPNQQTNPYAIHKGEDEEGHDPRERSQYNSGTTTETIGDKGHTKLENTKQPQPTSYSRTKPNMKISPRARAVDSAQSSSGNLELSKGTSSRGNSPMTSSWESFSKGVALKERKVAKLEERKREQEEKRKHDKEELGLRGNEMSSSTSGSMAPHTVTRDAQLHIEQEKYQELIDYLVRKQKSKENFVAERPDPHSQPSLPICKSANVVDLSPDKKTCTALRTHKRGIADAVETVHTRRLLNNEVPQPSHSPLHRDYGTTPHIPDYGTPHIPMSKSDPLPSSKRLSPLTKHHTHKSQQAGSESPTTQKVQSSREDSGLTKGKTRPQESVVTKPSLEETPTTATRLHERHRDQYVLQPSQTCTERDELLHRMYSSKPPSRYGPRPGPDDGIPPATVSLMLSGRLKSRLVSTHRSKRSGKHSHIRYYTKQT